MIDKITPGQLIMEYRLEPLEGIGLIEGDKDFVINIREDEHEPEIKNI